MDAIIRSCNRLAAPGALMLGMGIVGTSVTAGKFLVGNIPIMLANGIRFLLASIVLLVIVFVTEHRVPKVPLRFHLVLIAQALTGVVAFNVLLLLGLDMTTATMSGIITALIPAIIALISFTTGDRLGRLAWTGIVIGIAGVIFVNVMGAPDEDAARRPVLGALLIFLAVVGESTYTVLGRYAAQNLKPFTTAAYVSIYATTLFLPLALWDMRRFDVSTVPASTWLAILYLSIMVTIISFSLLINGLAVLPSSTAGAFTGLVPVMAIASAAMLLGERVGWVHVIGVIFVIIGTLLVANTRTVPKPCP